MTQQRGNPEFDIQIGEHGAETCVGIRPPMSGDQIKRVLAQIPARERPAQITPGKSKGDKPYTLLKFLHPHFGKYRNIYALNAVATIEGILSASGAVVNSNGTMRELHGDNKLFD